jgi:flagellar biosynthesis GTPase FlhF
MNRMLDDIEEPMRTVMPQITKSAETASRMLATMREPVERVAPALTQLADTLSNPLMTDLPRRMTETMDVLSSIPRALGPLGQVADLAGGFFGSRGLGAFGGTGRPSSSASRTSQAPVVVEAVVVDEGSPPPARPRWSRTAPTAQDTFRRSAAKHPAPKEPAPAKRTTAKKATKRTTAKATAKKAPAKKAPAEKAPAKKAPAKKAPAKKAPAKRSTAKKAAPRKTAAKRAAPTKAASRSSRSAGAR